MAWPTDLNNISSNMNTTELWALKEQMEAHDYHCDNFTGFAEYSSFDVTLLGIVYKFTEFNECIGEIYRYSDGVQGT